MKCWSFLEDKNMHLVIIVLNDNTSSNRFLLFSAFSFFCRLWTWNSLKGTICQIIIIESRILDSIEGWYLYSYSSFWSEGSKDLEARRRRTSKGGAVDEALQCTGVNMHFLELKNTVHPQIYRGIVPQHQLYLRQSNRTAKKFTLHICQQHVS